MEQCVTEVMDVKGTGSHGLCNVTDNETMAPTGVVAIFVRGRKVFGNAGVRVPRVQTVAQCASLQTF